MRRGCLLLGLLQLHCVGAAQLTRPSASPALSQRLHALLEAPPRGTHVAALVADSRSQQLIFAYNADMRFMPASTLKIITAAAALHYLGANYRFSTELWMDAADAANPRPPPSNLYLRGSGDPSLSEADLLRLAMSLRQQGVNSIGGDIVVDDSAFDAAPWAPGWMWDDLPEAYGSPVSGVNLMHNTLVLSLLPAARVGAAAQLAWAPMPLNGTPLFEVHSDVRTVPTGSSPNIQLEGLEAAATGLNLGQTLALSGSLPLGGPPWVRRLAVRDAAAYAGNVLAQQLRSLHIAFNGQVRRGVLAATAQRRAQHASPPLASSLIEFMKSSNNHGMECLLKRLGANTSLQPGSWKNGLAAVQQFLQQEVQLHDAPQLTLADGSGDSRYNWLTPRQLLMVLQHMPQQFTSGAEFMAALPLGGMDGTLKKSWWPLPLYGRVRAKTGNMTAVSHLAGYVQTSRAQVYSFVLMSEAFPGGAAGNQAMQRWQAAFLLELAQSTL